LLQNKCWGGNLFTMPFWLIVAFIVHNKKFELYLFHSLVNTKGKAFTTGSSKLDICASPQGEPF